MLSIWIIHRQPKARAAIARISGVGERAVLASPTDAVLDGADAPTVVVLGLSGDFEVELDFVHRHASKLGGCEWILLAAAEDVDEAQRLFDTLPGRFLVYPPEARVLRRALRAAVQHRDADPLSARQGRAELQARFARWFGDLELPELMRALDPRLARVPVLIHGEEGTGRGLLARYVHACGGHPEHTLVQISCAADTRASDLLQQMSVGSSSRDGALTFYLEDVDRLPISVQRRLRDWIEFGLPDGSAHRHGHRFMASVASAHDLDADPGLDPRLAETLSGLTIVLPPLRERGSHVAPFVVDTAASLARARGERARHFSAEALARLAAHPWPGNLHELEAVVTRTLAFTQADPIEPIHLRFPADLEWLGEPDGRNELEPEGLGEMPSGIHGDDIERPTAFPTPLVVPVAPAPEPLPHLEPIDDLADLDPGAEPGHEGDLEVGRVATLGAEPVGPEALEEGVPASFLEERPPPHVTPEPDEEEDLFPEDDLEDFGEDWLPDAELVAGDGDVLARPVEPGDGLTAELIDGDEDGSADLFAEVELIEEPDTAHMPRRPLDGRADLEPTDVEPTELLPGVEPLAPPVRPLPEAGEGEAIAASLAEGALPFDESFERPSDASIPAAAETPSNGIDARLYELVGAIAHEVRNPLVSIRTFSELLPDHYDDPEFRNHFRELVVKDVARIDRVVSRLQALAEGQRKTEPMDVARLLDRLLDERRPVIQSRRLLVLKELDHTSPLVLADAEQVEDAISGLLDRAIEQASERGDVYLASRHTERGLSGRPSVRILIRHTKASAGVPETGRVEAHVPDQAMLDLVLAKRLIEAQGGDLSVDESEAEAGESVIVVDLPAA